MHCFSRPRQESVRRPADDSSHNVRLLSDRMLQLSALGCEHVAKLTRLEWLEACGALLCNGGVRLLSGLTRLTYLSIAQNSGVNDAAYSCLTQLTKLQTLNASGTEMSAPEPAFLLSMRNLEAISMHGVKVGQRYMDLVTQTCPRVHLAGLSVVAESEATAWRAGRRCREA